MNQIELIKTNLINTNDSIFQELCDVFVAERITNYQTFQQTGYHKIKHKTTTGTPDTLFQLENGKYVMVEATTTEHKGNNLTNKLKKDIADCLNPIKSKISVDKIEEIILCYNANLTTLELEGVNKQAIQELGKPPKHYNLADLSKEIFLHHKHLAKEFLQIQLDTGQIVRVQKFIELYDNGKQKLATPLGGNFYNRTTELQSVINDLEQNDIVIISGPSGVGKSMLALEAIKQFTASNTKYKSFALSPKGVDILNDLSAYFSGDGHHILFIDDVNRVRVIDQILGYYSALLQHNLKIILTVRDYALIKVKQQISHLKCTFVRVGALNDNEVCEIIKNKPYQITDPDIQNKICQLAVGNARLAVMMALLINERQSITALNNTAQLFEDYFSTFVQDEDAFSDNQIVKVMGLVSFFHLIPYNDEKIMQEIYLDCNISESEFLYALDKLHQLDLIEMDYGYAKAGEQNLGAYYFYKVFIKDKLLSFDSFFFKYFKTQTYQFVDSLYPVYKYFGKNLVIDIIKPTLCRYLEEISHDENKVFDFLNFAWEFIPLQTFGYLQNKIETLPRVEYSNYVTEYKQNDFAYRKDAFIEFLSKFFKHNDYIYDAIELSFEYVKCNHDLLPQLIFHLHEEFIPETQDYVNHFQRQDLLVNFLADKYIDDLLFERSFLAVSKKFLDWFKWCYLDKTELLNNDCKNVSQSNLIRDKVLQILCNLDINFKTDVFQLLLNTIIIDSFSSEVQTLSFDLKYLIPLIQNKFNKHDFKHCYFVQELIRIAESMWITHQSFQQLKKLFEHKTYSVFKTLNRDRINNLNVSDEIGHTDFNQKKVQEIRNILTFQSIQEVTDFGHRLTEILNWKGIKYYAYTESIEDLIKVNAKTNISIGMHVFAELIKISDSSGNDRPFAIPYKSIEPLTMNSPSFEICWEIADEVGLNEKWKLMLLTSLSSNILTEYHLDLLYKTFESLNTNVLTPIKQE
jgi:hypothetical protein